MVRDRVRIAQIKVVPEKGELERNHAALMATLERVAAERPDVVVTPECFLDGYVSTEEWVTADSIGRFAVEPESSPYVAAVRRWADAASAWVVFGCSRAGAPRFRGAPEDVANTALVIDRSGALVGFYDKTHCQRHDAKYVRGESLPVFDSDFGRFGVMICADRRWPETVRSLALQGARIIFNPTYGMHDERNLAMMRTRSFESEVFIAFTHPRQSLVTDPEGGVVLNETSDDADFAVCEIDLARADAARAAEMSHLKDRRPELYQR